MLHSRKTGTRHLFPFKNSGKKTLLPYFYYVMSAPTDHKGNVLQRVVSCRID
jgi:hypothetical protein